MTLRAETNQDQIRPRRPKSGQGLVFLAIKSTVGPLLTATMDFIWTLLPLAQSHISQAAKAYSRDPRKYFLTGDLQFLEKWRALWEQLSLSFFCVRLVWN